MADAALGDRWLKWWKKHLNRLGPGDTQELRREARRLELSTRRALLVRGGPAAAAGFDRMVSHAVFLVVEQMTDHNPAPEYVNGWPRLAGDDWAPRPGATNVEHP